MNPVANKVAEVLAEGKSATGMTGAKAKLLPLNRKAFDKGIELAK